MKRVKNQWVVGGICRSKSLCKAILLVVGGICSSMLLMRAILLCALQFA